jgi:hypothetical protein
MAQVRLPGRPVTGQDPEAGRIPVNEFFKFGRTPQRQGGTHDYPSFPGSGRTGTKKAVHPGRPFAMLAATALIGRPPLRTRNSLHAETIAKFTSIIPNGPWYHRPGPWDRCGLLGAGPGRETPASK